MRIFGTSLPFVVSLSNHSLTHWKQHVSTVSFDRLAPACLNPGTAKGKWKFRDSDALFSVRVWPAQHPDMRRKIPRLAIRKKMFQRFADGAKGQLIPRNVGLVE